MRMIQQVISIVILFLLGATATAFATDFFVTTNANAGTGSLRAAIMAANSNTAGPQDRILFAIPATQQNDVVISLTEELPALTSNIIVDATLQPGNFFNSPSIKVQLLSATITLINGLLIVDASNVEIYGIYFTNFNAPALPTLSELRGAIYLKNASNITIGAPNKNNAFSNNYAGVYAPTEQHVLENVKIQCNYFGLMPDGISQLANRNGIDVSYLKNSVIGGAVANLGNLFGVNENIHINTAGMSEATLIANNNIGFNRINEFIPNPKSIGINANGLTSTLTIEDNLIGGQGKGIVLNEVNKGFFIRRNKVGTNTAAQNFGNAEVGIEINKSTSGIIGSTNANDKNDIAYNRDGIVINNSYPITISKNSMFCNTRVPIFFQSTVITTPIISSISGNTISGTYVPNGIIEVFANHECAGCQGKIYLGSVTVQANGTFLYSGSINGAVTLTGTNTVGATSGFTSPMLNDLGKQVTDEHCGSSNGSIKNIQVSDATVFTWYSASGAVVGNSRDLVNVKAGLYYLVAGQNGGCQVTSPTYEVKKIDVAYKIKDAALVGSACGKTNGSVIINSFEGEIPKFFTWLDEDDQIVSTERNLMNMMPGTYRLFGDNGLGCKTLAGTFTIEPTSDLVINTSKVLIVNTDCTKDEGSILNVSISGGTAPLAYQWFDTNNQEIATTRDLLNTPSGTYFLKITDLKGCTVQSGTFTIPPSPLNAKIADTFSPNGDGINDVWRIPGIEGLSEFEIKIFNRAGTLVFYTKNQAKDFDGKYKNVDLPVGIYYYTIDLKNSNCKGINGRIMLIR